jgi:hypothetical protein
MKQEHIVLPQHIIKAAEILGTYFEEQNIKKWKLLGCQRRDDHVQSHLNEWRDAVLDALSACCMDAPITESPASILERIIEWNIMLELDRVGWK